ncbi:MAG: NADH-quinone oxidoreductase subunit N [Myxococcota bacterium]
MTAILCVVALAGLVLAADLATPEGGGRGVGGLVSAGLIAILVATFWLPAGPVFPGFADDAFTAFLHRVLLAAGALGALGSVDHADRRFPKRVGEYYLLLLSSLVGMMLVAGARELVLLVVAFELMGIPLYALAAAHKTSAAGAEGATKMYLTGAVSAAVTMYGLSFVVGLAGGTMFADVAALAPSPLLGFGALLMLAGMAYKLGAVPFHLWVPDTYASAPAPFVAFLSVAPKAAAIAAVARLAHEALPVATWATPLLVVCGVTMVAGNLMAVQQTNVRRLLAFSGVAHIGLLLLALAVGTAEGLGVLLFYLPAYVAANMGAFLVTETVGDDLPRWRGLARTRPALALAMLLFLLSLAGIPFVAGFWAKVFVLWAAWQAGQPWLVLLAALLAVLALFYYLKVARGIYMEPPNGEAPAMPGRPTAAAIALALAGIVILGLWPRPVFDAAMEAGRVLVPSVASAGP